MIVENQFDCSADRVDGFRSLRNCGAWTWPVSKAGRPAALRYTNGSAIESLLEFLEKFHRCIDGDIAQSMQFIYDHHLYDLVHCRWSQSPFIKESTLTFRHDISAVQ
jgi:hypothetical protein